MNPSNIDNRVPKASIIEQIDELLSHPIKMQIFFFLSTLGKLSLSDLTCLIDKSKTTIHHHTKLLETKGILLPREKITKNYKEVVYELDPAILSIIKSQKELASALATRVISVERLATLFKSFSAFLFSIIDRFTHFLKLKGDQPADELDQTALNMYVTDYMQYSKILGKINAIFQQSLKKSSTGENIQDSYAIFTVAIPYGKLFGTFADRLKRDEEG